MSRHVPVRTRLGALLAAGSMFALTACGSSADAADTADGEGLIRVGFSQLGAESGWRTANTESVKASLTEENGFDLNFVDAQQKQENQIKALRDFVAQD